MDISKLITLIESHSPIWDSSDPLHANRDAVKKLWDEIQVEMKVAGGYFFILDTWYLSSKVIFESLSNGPSTL